MDDFVKKTKCDRCHGDFNGCRTMWISLHSSGIVCVVKGEVRSLAERQK